MSETDQVYLGDSVYASFDGYHVVLRANDGTQTIYLDPGVLNSLDQYVSGIRSGVVPDE